MKIGKFVVEFLKKHLVSGNDKRRKKYPSYDLFDGQLNIPFINDNYFEHKMDVFYAPKDIKKDIVIIDIHGGAYVFGNHRDNYLFSLEFIKAGFDFISIDYVPIQGDRCIDNLLSDCVTAINYIFSHIKELKLDNKQFVITGDSAGGHLAFMCALLLNKDIQEKLHFTYVDNVNFECLLLTCPVFNYENVGDGVLSKSGKRRLLGPKYNDLEYLKLYSPSTYIDYLKMPLFLSTCTRDFLREESLSINEIMKNRDNKYQFIDIHSREKKIQHVHNVLFPEHPLSEQVNLEMMKFILQVCEKVK